MDNSKRSQAEKTKRAILQAAIEVAREEGVDQLSANKIIRRAGISKGGFFHHFGQVEDLYLYMLDDLMLTLQQLPLPEEPLTFSRFIDHMAAALLDMYGRYPERVTILIYFFSQCQQKPEYRKRLRTMLANIFEVWGRTLDQLFGRPMSPTDSDVIVRLTDMFFLGFALHNVLLEDTEHYRKLAHQFGKMLENAYA